MAAAAPPVTNRAARAVIKRINQYGHGSPIVALPLFGPRFDLQSGAGFGRRGRVFDLQAPPFFAHAVASGLLHALFVRLRFLRRVPGALSNFLPGLPGPRPRLLFNLSQSLTALAGGM